jgi:hypothetical protein
VQQAFRQALKIFVTKLVSTLKKQWPAACFFGLALAMIIFAARLAQGPMGVDFAKKLISERLERALPQTRAIIEHMDLVWFHDSRALGLRFKDLKILDKKGRIIASGRNLEAALAIESLLVGHIAPARLTASDFFLVLSVSSQGRIDIGFTASGQPGRGLGLDRLLSALTGREKLGSPLSFTRKVDLNNGRLVFAQSEVQPLRDGPSWTGQLKSLNFTKLNDHISARFDLGLKTRALISHIDLNAKATTDLKDLGLSAVIYNFDPSQVLPKVGFNQVLGQFAASVTGRADVKYNATDGLISADIDMKAAKGGYDFGTTRHDFNQLTIEAHYIPDNKSFKFDRLIIDSSMIDAHLYGYAKPLPQSQAKPTSLAFDFDFRGPRVTGQLAKDFQPQTLTDVHIIGSYLPQARRLIIHKGKGILGTTPVETQGVVYTDEKGRLGADLTAAIKGDFSKETVFVFWPEPLSPFTRSLLIDRIRGGIFSNARFVFKAPPGHINTEDLTNEDLRLDFDYRDMRMSFDQRLKDAYNLKGHGILMGNRFDMSLSSGRLVNVDLTFGQLSVPSFHDTSTNTIIKLYATAEAVDAIEAIDPLTDNQLRLYGLNRDNLSGKAKVKLEIGFPTFKKITDKNLKLVFEADLVNAGLKKAALGWDLERARLKVRGDKLGDQLVISGISDLGPYRGGISYRTSFIPKAQMISFKGSLDAEPFGGSPSLRVPLTGEFKVEGGQGAGWVRSDVFSGDVTWRGKGAQPDQIDVKGQTLSSGLVAQGLPIFANLDKLIPTQVLLQRAGDIWSGALQAEGLSGDIAYIQGNNPRLVYKSVITPDEAQTFGLGGLPYFKIRRNLTLNIGLDAGTNETLITLDKLQASLGWSKSDQEILPLRTFKMQLRPEDWLSFGLPAGLFEPKSTMGLMAQWQQVKTRTLGVLTLDYGHSASRFDFIIPFRPEPLPENNRSYVGRLSGSIDEDLLKSLGYQASRLEIAGKLGMGFVMFYDQDQYSAILNLDAKDAALHLRGSLWDKPVGQKADFAMSFDEGNGGKGLNITRIYGASEAISVEGRAALNAQGRLEFADFSQIYLQDLMNIRARMYENSELGGRVVSISGSLLDIRPWLDIIGKTKPKNQVLADSNTTPSSQTTRLELTLEALKTSPKAFRKVRVSATFDTANHLKAQGQALSDNGSQVSFDSQPIIQKDAKILSRFRLKTDDLGNVLHTAIELSTLTGGSADIEGYFGQAQSEMTIDVRQIRARQIPIFAQLLSVASITGLADTMLGEGIGFRTVHLPMRYKQGQLYIKDGYAEGKALGIKIDGTYQTNGALNFEGILLPAYTFNALFGNLQTKGQGLWGIDYRIGGDLKAPIVEVDPLSFVMPGFIRKWYVKPKPDVIAPLISAPVIGSVASPALKLGAN